MASLGRFCSFFEDNGSGDLVIQIDIYNVQYTSKSYVDGLTSCNNSSLVNVFPSKGLSLKYLKVSLCLDPFSCIRMEMAPSSLQ